MQRRNLIAVEIYEEFGENLNTPEVRLMGNIHGNEDQGIFILI